MPKQLCVHSQSPARVLRWVPSTAAPVADGYRSGGIGGFATDVADWWKSQRVDVRSDVARGSGSEEGLLAGE